MLTLFKVMSLIPYPARNSFHLASLVFLTLLAVQPSPRAAEPARAAESPSTNSKKMTTPTNVTPAEAEALLHSQKQVLVIDVRTQEEFAEGHIAGAKNVNFNSATFLERMKEFEGKSILVHCAAGGRSTRALEALPLASFAEIYHLNKGFNAWVEAGKPVSTK